MIEETIRLSEPEILVFISSRQDEEMAEARALAIKTVDSFPGVRVWAFEDAPASSEAARERYIRNAGEAEIVIWLIGSCTSPPIVEEIEACRRAGSRLLPFKLPVQQRSLRTQKLIERVQEEVTWRTVGNVASLPDHIWTALTSEMVRAFRDPAPTNHDQFLRQRKRWSIATTKRLWATLGVPDDIAEGLAQDNSIGHKLRFPQSGVSIVMAAQGSGKTLATHRLYQQALDNRMKDHLQPLPVYLKAQDAKGNFQSQVEREIESQGSPYSQPVLTIIDGLDEVGRHEANQILEQAMSFADSNQNASVIATSRPLPGLKEFMRLEHLSPCDDEEFVAITSKIAGRPVNRNEIPHRIASTRLPLFAVIVGTHLRNTRNPLGASPSQMVSMLVHRILDESDEYQEETAEMLKTLAVATTNRGGSTPKYEVDRRTPQQARLADSRMVIDVNDEFDFAIAIFREWFAARALIEGTTSLADIDLTSDRWVAPLAISINSENPNIGPEFMETLASQDPAMAALVLEEVKHSWSMEEPKESLPPGTALEIGNTIRHAMSNWREGLGPLMPAIGPVASDGSIPTLAVDKGPRMVTTKWYRGNEELETVIELPKQWAPFSYEEIRDWYPWRSTVIEHTRVWPWTTTLESLRNALSRKLDRFGFALDSTIGIQEFTEEFANNVRWYLPLSQTSLRISELVNWIDEWTNAPGRGPKDAISFGQHIYDLGELKLIRDTLSELSREGNDTIPKVWPGEDKPWPDGRSSVLWHELYSEEQLLKRTNAIFSGAIRVYNDIVEQSFPAFDKRDQMKYRVPLKLEGKLCLGGTSTRRGWNDATLIWWPRLASSREESGAFFELGTRETAWDDTTREKIKIAEREFIDRDRGFHYGTQILPGNEARPATKLAHDWLKSDLRDLRWA